MIGAKSIKAELLASVQNINSEDWSIAYSDSVVKGFPYRFDLTINNLKVKIFKNKNQLIIIVAILILMILFYYLL